MAARRSTAIAYLYVVTCKKNKRKYIGVTNHPYRRWSDHLSGKGQKTLYEEVEEYGPEAFNFSILSTGPRWAILELERALIALWDTQVPSGYNVAPGGNYVPPAKRRKRKKRK